MKSEVCEYCPDEQPSVLDLTTEIMDAAYNDLHSPTPTISSGQFTRIAVAIAQKLTNVPAFIGDYAENCEHTNLARDAALIQDWNVCADELEHGH